MWSDPARASRLALAALVSLSAWSSAAAAEPAPKVVNRIVAVVGEEPITLHALLRRALPYQKKIDASPPGDHAAATRALLADLLERMVDEALFERRAAALRLQVTPDEIERALKMMAQNVGGTVPELLATVAKDGVSEADVRAQARQQLLEYKVLAAERVDLSSRDEAELARRSKRYIEATRKVVAVEVRL